MGSLEGQIDDHRFVLMELVGYCGESDDTRLLRRGFWGGEGGHVQAEKFGCLGGGCENRRAGESESAKC